MRARLIMASAESGSGDDLLLEVWHLIHISYDFHALVGTDIESSIWTAINGIGFL